MLETQCSSSSVLDNIADNAKNITFVSQSWLIFSTLHLLNWTHIYIYL